MLETTGLSTGELVGKVHLWKGGVSGEGQLSVHLRTLQDWRRPSQGQERLEKHGVELLLPVAVPETGHFPF